MKNKLTRLLLSSIWLCSLLFLVTHNEPDFYQAKFLENSSTAISLFIIIQIFCGLLILPCSVLTIAAGYVLGLSHGVALSTIGTLLSTFVTYAVGRYSPIIKSSNIFVRFSKYVKKNNTHYGDFFLATALQGNPFLPGSSLGYVFGAKGYNPAILFFASLVGTLPLQLIVTGIGVALKEGPVQTDANKLYYISGYTFLIFIYALRAIYKTKIKK